ncbi:MAG TPA: ester cyclase [Dehalococcoidia bacterium]|nr:ester cyclase [Dehalococcoidia bacterium]
MSVENNKLLVLRLLNEGVNQKKLGIIDEVIASDCAFHISDGQTVIGVNVVKQMITAFFDAFDGFRVTIEDIIGEDDKVVVRFFESGKHQGEFEGITPTGNEVVWVEIAIFRIENNKIVEAWTLEDKLNLMKQLGTRPPPEEIEK